MFLAIGPNLRALKLIHVMLYMSLVEIYESQWLINKISPQPLPHKDVVDTDWLYNNGMGHKVSANTPT